MTSSALLLRRTGIRLFDALGINRLLQPHFAGAGVTLMLHSVVDSSRAAVVPGMAIDAEFLGAALSEFQRLGFDFVRASEIPERLQARSGARFVCVTLDDGYRDNLTVALPLFRALGVPFSVYPTIGFLHDDGTAPPEATAHWNADVNFGTAVLQFLLQRDSFTVDGKRRTVRTLAERREAEHVVNAIMWKRECSLTELYGELLRQNESSILALKQQTFLSWTELRTLARDPLVEIGGHGLTHRPFATLGEDEVVRETRCSRAMLEQAIGRPVTSIAFPYGGLEDAKQREFTLAAHAGYRVGFTTVRANLRHEHSDCLLRLPRLGLSLAPHGRSLAFVRGIAHGGQHAVLNRFRRFVV